MGLCFSSSVREIPISSGRWTPKSVSSRDQGQNSKNTATNNPRNDGDAKTDDQKGSHPVSRAMSSTAAAGTILGKPMVNVHSLYKMEKELGRGQFGITYRCTELATGIQYACKTIAKSKLVTKADIEDMKREVMILQHLTGQPNIVEFKGAYEDGRFVHLVMELCSGGELFDRIIAKGSYSEKEAARICRQIANVVNACHFMGVIHRDLKPENFLLESKDDNSPIKATDFGLSVFIEQGQLPLLVETSKTF